MFGDLVQVAPFWAYGFPFNTSKQQCKYSGPAQPEANLILLMEFLDYMQYIHLKQVYELISF